jgi:hypothetical protein
LKYQQFLESKRFEFQTKGIEIERSDLNSYLKDHQLDITRWALKKGRAAVFAGTGLGKTIIQLEWAEKVHKQTEGKILVLAPLAVASQTVREGQKIDLNINLCRQQSDVKSGINITNYEMLHKFNPQEFDGVVLDESSILKAYNGKTRTEIIESFRNTPFRLACTATPSPNDYMELGNHSEFLGVMSRSEMLSMFFVHDGGETQKWRLKGHAESKFWEWVSSWAVMIQKPSDLGYDDGDYNLPPLNIVDHVVKTDKPLEGVLVREEARTLQERQQARRDSIEERVAHCADIVNATDKPFLIWCGLNGESEMIRKAIPDAVEVTGSDSPEYKEKAMMDFADGKIRVLVSKTSICGFGMNWQHCADMAFVGLTDSFEAVFQAIRRCYRFGQKNPVNVQMIVSDLEGAVSENLKRKERDFEVMAAEMLKHTRKIMEGNIRATTSEKTEYKPQLKMIIPSWLRSEAS